MCVKTRGAGPHVNAVSVIELCYNYPEEIILTYSLCVRKKPTHNSFAGEGDGAGWHSLSEPLSRFFRLHCVTEEYDGSIFILSQ